MDKAKELISRYLRNECTTQERQFLDRWFHEHNLNNDLDLTQDDFDKAKQLLLAKTTRKRPIILRWGSVAAVAVLAIGITVSINSYNNNNSKSQDLVNVASNEIKNPLLLIDNTRSINLTQVQTSIEEVGKINDEYGNDVYVFENKEKGFLQKAIRNTLVTPRQQTLKMQLPDGTTVWLNSLSEISFNANFKDEKFREVSLKGEAYFEVAKDREKPFRVLSGNQVVEVLGTHFNVNTNTNGIATSLLEGSVVVKNNNQTRLLKPGEQAVFQNNSFKIGDFDEELLLDWKEGDFLFKKEMLTTILKRIGVWYEVSFLITDNHISDQTFSGRISRNSTIDDCLFILEQSCGIKFEKGTARKYKIIKNLNL